MPNNLFDSLCFYKNCYLKFFSWFSLRHILCLYTYTCTTCNLWIWGSDSFYLFVALGKFSLIWKVTITYQGLQILTYTPHPWPLSSEDSLVYPTSCDGIPVYMVIFQGLVTLALTFSNGAVNTYFNDLSL